ncbi:hypothetical protein AOX55_0000135 [Sinorhizobium fredii CCBAU 25509]|nr:hypothetical protein SF83666_c01350 [Sinorhizobium fredii CCBAU 83666]AWM23420.1 hypothetical protein AOX55_0000135 [Sinorhizobium fredii CCBAU 25509]
MPVEAFGPPLIVEPHWNQWSTKAFAPQSRVMTPRQSVVLGEIV